MYDDLNIYHISLECYPVAKVGGLADVVGALPKYQNKLGAQARVVMPWYDKPFIHEHQYDRVFENTLYMDGQAYFFEVIKEATNLLGFELYLVKVHGLMDREKVYGYDDEMLQFIGFQRAVLQWLCWQQRRPDILHCHDYHTGLIPFFIENCPEYSFLKGVRTIGTIHNGQYQGWMDWEMSRFFAPYNEWSWGKLDWQHAINSLATMIKCCHAFNAVSQGYLDELYHKALGLETLIQQEHNKAYGIINGIDVEVWNPKVDPMVVNNFGKYSFVKERLKNKKSICKEYGLDPELPLFSFIGRFALEKGADILPDVIRRCIIDYQGRLNFVVLGSGDPKIEQAFTALRDSHYLNFALDLGYNEALSHRIYSSTDFLIMPSRVEPCGLNQMYSMRYGTMPIVRLVGGLKDTVRDIGDDGGYGITFRNFNVEDILHALSRAIDLYFKFPKALQTYQQRMMNLDFSWEASAKKYLEMYRR